MYTHIKIERKKNVPMLLSVALRSGSWSGWRPAVCYNQVAAVGCSALQCVAVCCSVLRSGGGSGWRPKLLMGAGGG